MALKSKALDTPTKHQRPDGAGALGRVRELSAGAQRERSEDQEKALASRVGGRVTPGSGCFMGNKGDVKSDDFLIECKRTDSASLRVTAEWLAKITKEAVEAGRFPALHFSLGGAPEASRDWVIVPLHVFCAMTKRAD